MASEVLRMGDAGTMQFVMQVLHDWNGKIPGFLTQGAFFEVCDRRATLM